MIIDIDDSRQLDEAHHPVSLAGFTSDQFKGVIDRYLTPVFQYDVYHVAPTPGGKPCVVVRLPSRRGHLPKESAAPKIR